MSEPRNAIYAALKKGLLAQLGFAPFLGAGLPTNPNQVPFIEPAPDGLKLLYAAPTVPEAELLRQILTEAGFAVEFVPSTEMGVFGISGNPCIYVRDTDYAEAHAFLMEYLAATPEDSAEASPPPQDDKDPV